MSHYNPTLEEIRFTYATNEAVLKERAWDESVEDATRRLSSQFDRWLAVHDAEVRAGVIAEEPEWEYGVRLHPDIEYKPNENRAAYTPPTTPHTTLERAQEMAGLNPRYRATYHRRVKAGPWEPLEN